MKVFFIIPSLGTGGAERVGVIIANGLHKRGHEIVVFTNLQMRKDYTLEKGIECIDIGFKRSKLIKWFMTIRLLRLLSKVKKPDVVIGIMSICSLVGYISTIGLRIPVVETIHSSMEKPNYAQMSLWERFYKFYVSRIYPFVTVLTEADCKVVSNNHNMIVMPNPLALEPVKDFSLKENLILAAGRLDDWHYKGFDVLIKAWEKIVKSEELIVNRYGWKLQIAGTGSEKSLNYLKGLCIENGVEEYVEFLGFQKDVEKLYQRASIFVLSSRYEGFGLVLIEAMSQGCACIACDYKGRQKEILRSLTPNPSPKGEGELPTEGSGAAEPETRNSKIETRNSETETRNSHVELCKTGILCEPDDVDALAESMRKMMTDDQYRESVRMKAVERSKYYSLENTMDRWEYLLNQLVEK